MQQKDLVMKKGDILFCNTIQVKSKKGTSKDLFNLVADQLMPVVRELRMNFQKPLRSVCFKFLKYMFLYYIKTIKKNFYLHKKKTS